MKLRVSGSKVVRLLLAAVVSLLVAACSAESQPLATPGADAEASGTGGQGGSSQTSAQDAELNDGSVLDTSSSDATTSEVTLSDTTDATSLNASDATSSDTGSDAGTDSAAPTAQTKWFAEGFGDVEAITRGPDDTLWFISTAGKIGHLKAETDIPTFQIDTAVIAGTTGRNRIVKGPDGNLWFTIEKMSRFGTITPAGVITVFSGALTINPDDITVGPDGNLWVSGSGLGVARITPAGTVTNFPCGANNTILSAPDGNLWFVDLNMGIGRITPAGIITQFPLLENNEGSVSHGLALANGQLWAIGVRTIGMVMIPPEELPNLPFTRHLSTTGAFVGAPTVLRGYRIADPLIEGTSTAIGPDGAMWYYEGKLEIGRVSPSGAVQRFPIPDPGTTYRFSKMTFDASGALWLPMRGGLLRFTLVP